MELIVGFFVMAVVVLWAFGVPISLIIIAVKMSGMYRITLNSLQLSKSIIQRAQEELEKESSWDWDAVSLKSGKIVDAKAEEIPHG